MKRRRCRRCKAHILAGYDDEVCALWTTVDTAQLDALGEIAALTDGRTTYELDRGRLRRRNRWRIAGHPAGSVAVFAAHRC